MSAGPFYLQHGTAPAPCRTEAVEVRESFLSRPYVRNGCIPTYWQVRFEGRWHRVYSRKNRAPHHFIRSRHGDNGEISCNIFQGA